MKKLKILLGNNTLSLLAGSETWTLTLALELHRMGHHVACFAPDLGLIANELEKAGVHCYSDLTTSKIKPFSPYFEPSVDHDYDVIIANHNHIVDYLRSQYPKKPIISTIHGIIHLMDGKGGQVKAPEHPALESGVNQFVAVSEEVRDMLQKDYHIEATIIRNFFDIKKFNAKRPISLPAPKQFFVNTNYAGKGDAEIEVIREVAKHYGAKLTAVGENFSQALDVTRAIEDADVVVGMGRSVLEGVAAGRLGIVHGRWGTGGVITEDTVESLRSWNFSGRDSGGTLATATWLINQIDLHYKQDTIDWGKRYMAQNHNVALAADAYLSIARELTGQTIVPSVPHETGWNPGMKKIKFAHD